MDHDDADHDDEYDDHDDKFSAFIIIVKNYDFFLLWYCLVDYDTRRRQGVLAKHAGIFGFIFYHFWFSGKASPIDHKVMFKVPGKIEMTDIELWWL